MKRRCKNHKSQQICTSSGSLCSTKGLDLRYNDTPFGQYGQCIAHDSALRLPQTGHASLDHNGDESHLFSARSLLDLRVPKDPHLGFGVSRTKDASANHCMRDIQCTIVCL